ncbi:threonine/serine exporter family protein [Siminovitchia sp. 179-K 8D1 HS]|uniref:threonine/serine exporter family protein n=1 Tax=Siminovitchia sp. 179-K 8D1 HS TaxID=3142385 RepID=UPI0039A2B08D
MSYMLTQFVMSFIAAAGFGIIFNAPRKSLVSCGVCGTVGWMVFRIMTDQGIDAVQASFAGAFAVALAGHGMTKYYRAPIIIFVVAGIIPLVPGGAAYDAMRHIVSNDYSGAIPLASKAFIISGAIAMGLVFAEVFVQLASRIREKKA